MKTAVLLLTVEWDEKSQEFHAKLSFPEAHESVTKRHQDLFGAVSGATEGFFRRNRTLLCAASERLRGAPQTIERLPEQSHQFPTGCQ